VSCLLPEVSHTNCQSKEDWGVIFKIRLIQSVNMYVSLDLC
jgi:hypothetical protein